MATKEEAALEHLEMANSRVNYLIGILSTKAVDDPELEEAHKAAIIAGNRIDDAINDLM